MTGMAGIFSESAVDGTGSLYAIANAMRPPMFPKGTVLRIFTGNMADQGDTAVAETILTKSMNCAGDLKKPGDVAVIDKQGTFDKAGEYHLYLYYAELPADYTPEKESTNG